MSSQNSARFAILSGLIASSLIVVGCSTDGPASSSSAVPAGDPAALVSPATQGQLWACKFSVDPVTKLPNGDVTTGKVSASISSGDGVLEPAFAGGGSALIGYNTPASVPQCVKVWSGGTSATVAVTEDPEPGSALLFSRLVKRVPGATYDDVYFTLDPVLSPPSEGPYTVNVQVDNGAAYEVWFKNVVVTAPPPDGGCTYTLGYWKTHSRQGPAPYDAAWKNLGPNEEATLFFNSGATWYQTFNTPPRGNAFYILAHQYMAARLNVLNGASTTAEVDAALSGAASLFSGLAAGSTTLTSEQRAQATAWAATLDSYNNGITGPGHCS
jgi:hypothetical protein